MIGEYYDRRNSAQWGGSKNSNGYSKIFLKLASYKLQVNRQKVKLFALQKKLI